MNCSCGKINGKGELSYQSFPINSMLFNNLNLNKKDISLILESDKPKWILAYTIDSVKFNNNKMLQTGCGPNIEGDLISLCTCKHQMRAYQKNRKEWEGNWVAAFCSKRGKENALFYLMKIEKAYCSHYSFWSELTSQQRQVKSANKSIFGDIYEPKNKTLSGIQKHQERFYKQNKEKHKHDYKDRKKDIEKKYFKRFPALLRGEVKKSFIWENPKIKSLDRERRKFRTKYYESINNFVNQLGEL